MFGSIDQRKGPLFRHFRSEHSLRATMQNIQVEVDGLNENRSLNTTPEDLKSYLVERDGVASREVAT